MKRNQAKLRVCASCEWIFLENEKTKNKGCPKCGFASYGARFVYGKAAYRYKLNQQPWVRKKLGDYMMSLLKEIESSRV